MCKFLTYLNNSNRTYSVIPNPSRTHDASSDAGVGAGWSLLTRTWLTWYWLWSLSLHEHHDKLPIRPSPGCPAPGSDLVVTDTVREENSGRRGKPTVPLKIDMRHGLKFTSKKNNYLNIFRKMRRTFTAAGLSTTEGQEQRGVHIIELKLVSHGSDTLFNLMLGSDWTIGSLIPPPEKRLIY